MKTADMRKKFGTSLPSLLRTDPIVRYYHFQKGDVIRVTRRNGTQIYRLVK
jgi:DNA-directed RNA polymerase subunit H (RpoH/RPB5)